jgi:hypothetical protein
MTSWNYNKTCPLCDRVVEPGPDWSETFHLPDYNFTRMPKVFRDVLPETDPLRRFCFQMVHWNCYASWPERQRFAMAYADWVAEHAEATPHSGVAFRNEEFLVTAPSASEGRRSLVLLIVPLMCSLGFSAKTWERDFQEWLDRAEHGHSLYRQSVRSGLEFLRSRFPTLESAVQSVNWEVKKTPCEICSKPLGANPASERVFRTPHGYGEMLRYSTGPLGAFTGALVHSECFVEWPDRRAFGAMLADGERRMSAFSETLGCAYTDDLFVLLVERDIEWRNPILRLAETGTRVDIDCRKWTEWLQNPGGTRFRLHPFETEALNRVIGGIRSRFPTMAALSDAVAWENKKPTRDRAVEALKAECARLAALPDLICPSCGQPSSGVNYRPQNDFVLFSCCGRDACPFDFGWLP